MTDLPTSTFPFILSDKLSYGKFYAEIEHAGSRWLPWRGRTSRWWFEVCAVDDAPETPYTTYAYVEGGSGGAYTLKKCISRADAALWTFTTKENDS